MSNISLSHFNDFEEVKNLNDQYFSIAKTKWRALILTLYQAKCLITKQHIDDKEGEPLEAHPLYCRSTFPEKEIDANNGVLIKCCIDLRFHQLYGHVGVIPEEFEEFLRDHYNIYSYSWRSQDYYKTCILLVKRFLKSPEFYAMRLENEIEKREHMLRKNETPNNKYLNKDTVVIITCKKHGGWLTERKTAHNYWHQKFGMSYFALDHKKINNGNNKEKSKREREKAWQSFENTSDFINQLHDSLDEKIS